MKVSDIPKFQQAVFELEAVAKNYSNTDYEKVVDIFTNLEDSTDFTPAELELLLYLIKHTFDTTINANKIIKDLSKAPGTVNGSLNKLVKMVLVQKNPFKGKKDEGTKKSDPQFVYHTSPSIIATNLKSLLPKKVIVLQTNGTPKIPSNDNEQFQFDNYEQWMIPITKPEFLRGFQNLEDIGTVYDCDILLAPSFTLMPTFTISTNFILRFRHETTITQAFVRPSNIIQEIIDSNLNLNNKIIIFGDAASGKTAQAKCFLKLMHNLGKKIHIFIRQQDLKEEFLIKCKKLGNDRDYYIFIDDLHTYSNLELERLLIFMVDLQSHRNINIILTSRISPSEMKKNPLIDQNAKIGLTLLEPATININDFMKNEEYKEEISSIQIQLLEQMTKLNPNRLSFKIVTIKDYSPFLQNFILFGLALHYYDLKSSNDALYLQIHQLLENEFMKNFSTYNSPHTLLCVFLAIVYESIFDIAITTDFIYCDTNNPEICDSTKLNSAFKELVKYKIIYSFNDENRTIHYKIHSALARIFLKSLLNHPFSFNNQDFVLYKYSIFQRFEAHIPEMANEMDWDLFFNQNIHLKTLDLNFLYLHNLSPKIEKLHSLEEMSLRNNRFQNIPDCFDHLQSLKKIDFGFNNLITIPSSICNLSKLEFLGLDYNQLYDLPENIGKLKSLRKLSIQHNNLVEFHVFGGNLNALTYISLASNQISIFPENLLHLENMEQVILDHNKIKSIPEKIDRLAHLDTLQLQHNKIKTVPESIWRLPLISNLNLRENPLLISQENMKSMKPIHESVQELLFKFKGFVNYLFNDHLKEVGKNFGLNLKEFVSLIGALEMNELLNIQFSQIKEIMLIPEEYIVAVFKKIQTLYNLPYIVAQNHLIVYHSDFLINYLDELLK